MTCLLKDKIGYQLMVNDFETGGVPVVSKIIQLPQLSFIKKEQGIKTVLKYLVLLLEDLQRSFNIKNKMDTDQLIELANNLMNDYWGFRLIDFSICFRNAKKNEYGKVYERLDMATVYNFVQQYDLRRSKEITRLKQGYKQDEVRYERTSEQRHEIEKDPKFREILLTHIKNQQSNGNTNNKKK